MRAADRALYAAKDLGKDRTAIYSPEVARVLARASGSQGGDLQLAPLMSLAEALDVRDTGNAVHSRTVGRYARITAVELGLNAERVERVRVAGVLHDVGKIGVSDPVLVKTGPLGEDDWRELRTHPEIGGAAPVAARAGRPARLGARPPRAPGRHRLPGRAVRRRRSRSRRGSSRWPTPTRR